MRYYPALDGLRAVSVLLVFLVHENLRTFPGGFIGVDIFFVISGFLITTILLDEHNVFGKISIKKFFIRRIIRLWPALYTMLLILLVGILAIGVAGKYEAAFEWSSFYMMNWYMAFSLGDGYFLTHLWSLAVEEQFYLLWPLAIIILVRLPVNVAISFLILFMIGVTTWRIALVTGPANRLYHGLDTRIDTIIAGTVLGVYLQKYPHTNLVKLGKYYFLPIIVLFAMVFYAHWDSKFMDTIGFDIIYVCAVWIVYVCCFIDDSILCRVMCLPLLVHLGKRSYGFYLWHLPILYIIKKKTEPFLAISKEQLPLKAIVFISGLALSYCACAASYSFLEKKILSIKKKYQPFESLKNGDDLCPTLANLRTGGRSHPL
jgi:peptidoglycan/LPS O-acetylase OafA/YrhL